MPKKIGIVLIDVSKNKVIKKAGIKQSQDEALDVAAENGLYRVTISNTLSSWHMCKSHYFFQFLWGAVQKLKWT